jgi:hypothetical protein
MNDNRLETLLKDSLAAEPPAEIDARISRAIRQTARERQRTARRIFFPMAAAASLMILLSGGWLWRTIRPTDVISTEESDLVLEILGMAGDDILCCDVFAADAPDTTAAVQVQ